MGYLNICSDARNPHGVRKSRETTGGAMDYSAPPGIVEIRGIFDGRKWHPRFGLIARVPLNVEFEFGQAAQV